MVIPKYDINQIVFIYDKGKLVERTINKIQVLITEETTEVGYQFVDNNVWLRAYEIFKPEHEVFKSLEHSIKVNS